MESELAEGLTHRDHLARHRTHLANERTLLAYVRTAASFIVLGLAIVHFLNDVSAQIFGWLSVAGGAAILALGIFRFRLKRDHIHHTPS